MFKSVALALVVLTVGTSACMQGEWHCFGAEIELCRETVANAAVKPFIGACGGADGPCPEIWCADNNCARRHPAIKIVGAKRIDNTVNPKIFAELVDTSGNGIEDAHFLGIWDVKQSEGLGRFHHPDEHIAFKTDKWSTIAEKVPNVPGGWVTKNWDWQKGTEANRDIQSGFVARIKNQDPDVVKSDIFAPKPGMKDGKIIPTSWYVRYMYFP